MLELSSFLIVGELNLFVRVYAKRNSPVYFNYVNKPTFC